MRWSSGRTGEQGVGIFYLKANAWATSSANSYATGLRGVNLRGCILHLLHQASQVANRAELGTAVGLGCTGPSTVGAVSNEHVVGVLESDMILGQDPLVDVWVMAVVYGVASRIACDGTLTDKDDYLYKQEISEAFSSRPDACVVSAAADTVTLANHGFVLDQRIMFESTGAPAELANRTIYFARDITTNTFKVAAGAGGAAIDITTAGTAVNVFHELSGFDATDRGLAIGYSRLEAQQPRRLTGLLLLALDGAASSVVVDFSGATVVTGGNTASWPGSAPGKVNNTHLPAVNETRYNVPLASQFIFATQFLATQTVPPDVVTGGDGIPYITSGYVRAMGFALGQG